MDWRCWGWATSARVAMPVMEGKCDLFKALAGLDGWPICLVALDPDRFVASIESIATSFAGINLKDIAAPRCFEIEQRLQGLHVPMIHDDQHGMPILAAVQIEAKAVVVTEAYVFH